MVSVTLKMKNQHDNTTSHDTVGHFKKYFEDHFVLHVFLLEKMIKFLSLVPKYVNVESSISLMNEKQQCFLKPFLDKA